MITKIVVEIVLGFILLSISFAFWNCVKSPKFLAKILGDYEELKRFYHYLGKEKIELESKKIEPLPFDENPNIGFQVNIALWIKASISALDKTRNMLFVAILGILIGSYFLGNAFLLINVLFFIVMAFPNISASAKNNIITDIHVLMVNVCKWNKIDHNECERFCNLEQPKILKNIYTIVTEE
jgi:hypothetical protein